MLVYRSGYISYSHLKMTISSHPPGVKDGSGSLPDWAVCSGWSTSKRVPACPQQLRVNQRYTALHRKLMYEYIMLEQTTPTARVGRWNTDPNNFEFIWMHVGTEAPFSITCYGFLCEREVTWLCEINWTTKAALTYYYCWVKTLLVLKRRTQISDKHPPSLILDSWIIWYCGSHTLQKWWIAFK